MENKKENKSVIALLVIIITILAVFGVLFATGTISCNANKLIGYNSETKENVSDEKQNSDNIMEKFIGTFSYEGKYIDTYEDLDISNVEIEELIYEEVKLNSSGYAEARGGNVCAGGYSAKGKWYISNNELIIINEECQPVIIDGKIEYPNCTPIWTYTYEIDNEKVILKSGNNSMEAVILNKVN